MYGNLWQFSPLSQCCFSAVRGCFCSSPLRVFLQVRCCFELHSLLLMSSLPRRTLSLPEIIMINLLYSAFKPTCFIYFLTSLMAGLICRLHFSSFLQNVEGWGPGPTQHCLSECKSDTQKSLVSRCWAAPRIGRKQRFWLPSCPLDILLQPTYIFTLLIYIYIHQLVLLSLAFGLDKGILERCSAFSSFWICSFGAKRLEKSQVRAKFSRCDNSHLMRMKWIQRGFHDCFA